MKKLHCSKCGGLNVIRRGVRRGKIKYFCKGCVSWFQINRGERKQGRRMLALHLSGLSYRSLGTEFGVNASTAYRRSLKEFQKLPHCADITRRFCDRFCGVLLVDGKFVHVKGYERKIPVLYGIDYLTHDIPTYILSVAENYQTCRSFFLSLRLLNYPLKAIVSDDNQNIYRSCVSVYRKAVTQLCYNHYKQSIRNLLGVRSDSVHVPFMKEIEFLFKKKRSREEFLTLAAKTSYRHRQNPTYAAILLDIQKRLPQLLAYTAGQQIPVTNNLIESYNSHFESRLKSIKGFDSFKQADCWLNAYFIKRRLKNFTDCTRKFHYLNHTCSLQQTIKTGLQLSDVYSFLK